MEGDPGVADATAGKASTSVERRREVTDNDEAIASEHIGTILRMLLGSGVESDDVDDEDDEIWPSGPESPEIERLRHALKNIEWGLTQ